VYRYGSLKDDVAVTNSISRTPKTSKKRRVIRHRAKVAMDSRSSTSQRSSSAESYPSEKTIPPGAPRPEDPKPTSAEGTSPPRKLTIPAPATKPVPSAEAPLPPVDDPAAVAEMLAEGQSLFEQGKVVQARRHFVAAMNGPVPEVLLALGRSYDTYYLSRLPTADGAPDMQRALVLYERALERGAKEAAPDLERTRGVLKIPR
jgi:hypothetical protein